MDSPHSIEIHQVQGNDWSTKTDLLAIEEPMEIHVHWEEQGIPHQKNISITMRSPGNDEDLAIGFLVTEGIIHSPSQIKDIRKPTARSTSSTHNRILVQLMPGITIDLNKLERHFYTSSSCGVCGKSSIEAIYSTGIQNVKEVSFNIDRLIIHHLPDKLRQAQSVFDDTGGLHAAALFDQEGNLQLLREDVGRHNALDKLIGAAFRQNDLPLHHSLVMLSGRASFELIQKALMAGIPLIAAVGAPSSLAVQLANDSGMTLLGFVRAQRYNIYCHPQRIF